MGLLRNVVKPEGVDDPISVSGCAGVHTFPPLFMFSSLSPVKEILAWTQTEMLMMTYDLPIFTLTLEFLTMLVLSLDASKSVLPHFFHDTKIKNISFPVGWYPRHPLSDAPCSHQLELPKKPFFSEPPALHAMHMPSAIPSSGGQIAPQAKHRL